ncbi:NADP-dependent oxidoreductase domain-containing protein [Hypoxylon sp. NC1633]|nr:NADP-dependent oxidoreductase domain-containing protein [Hypoxylon sp. NC1633]
MPLSKPLPPTGFGLLGMTWRPQVTPDEQAFQAMKAAIANGATIWSTSSIYGMLPEPPTAGLHLLRRYFTKYPEDADKVTLFVRACYDAATLMPVNTRDGVRSSAAECNKILGDFKKIDVFGPARMDANVPIKETMGALKELMEEGAFGAVGLSEVRAETIRAASTFCPISIVEIEFSLWSTKILTNGVAETCKELDIHILTYSPLGYGFLTGQVRKLEDIPKGDIRHMFGRFQPEHFHKNIELVDNVTAIAEKKGVTPAQLALAWIRAHSNKGNCGTIIPIPGATAASRVSENCVVVELTAEEKGALDAIIETVPVSGCRQIPDRDDNIWT